VRVAIIHKALNSTGGGERVAVHTIKLLMDMGFDVVLATTEPTNWKRVKSILGVELPKKPKEVNLLPFRIPAFGIYQRLATNLLLGKIRKLADIVINTHGDMLMVPADVTYLHFPILAYWYRGRLKPWLKYLRSTFWRIYFTVWQLSSRYTKYLDKTIFHSSTHCFV